MEAITFNVGLPAFYILLPFGVVVFSELSGIIRKVQPIILCYLVGIIIGNIGILPEKSMPILDLLSTVTVALSIPLMLFTIDLQSVRTLSKKALVSMIFAFTAICISSMLGFLLLTGVIPEAHKISGLIVGVYTGGTPNLAALQRALKVDLNLYLAVHTADVFIGGIYLFFLITVGRNIFRLLLPAYSSSYQKKSKIQSLNLKTLRDLASKENRYPLISAIGLALLVVAIGAGLSAAVPENLSSVVAILAISTLSLGLSFIPRLRRIKQSFHVGEYVILIFCTVAGSMADIRQFATDIPFITLFVAFSIFVSIFIHLGLCKIFRIDSDTMMITSTSALYSPPFVPIVAIALQNRDIIVVGITAGLVGYAAGNYLGVLITQFLQLF